MTQWHSQHSPEAGPGARPILALCAILLAWAAAAPAQAAESGLKLSDPWIRMVMPSRPAAGYFTLSNDSAVGRALVGADSPACGMLMLHQSLNESGVERMAMVKSVPVPAHGSVKFSPGGFHLMCMSPSAAVAPGHSVAVTLHFADGGAIAASFPVRGATGK